MKKEQFPQGVVLVVEKLGIMKVDGGLPVANEQMPHHVSMLCWMFGIMLVARALYRSLGNRLVGGVDRRARARVWLC